MSITMFPGNKKNEGTKGSGFLLWFHDAVNIATKEFPVY